MQSAGDDQALDDADVPGAEFGPTKKPRFSAHGDDTQRALDMVRVDRYVRVGEEYFQAHAPLSHVVECWDERTARREALSLELPLDPLEKHLDPRFAVGQPVQLLVLAREVALADLCFDAIDRLDLLEGLGDPRGVGFLGFEEGAAFSKFCIRLTFPGPVSGSHPVNSCTKKLSD